MPGPLDDFKEKLISQIDRVFDTLNASLANDLPQQAQLPVNPFGTSYTADEPVETATGYNSGTGETSVPFTWGISVWGAGDVWFGS